MSLRNALARIVTLSAALGVVVPLFGIAGAATIEFEFGEGFSDTTPAAPIGGNPGTTIGEQRRLAFEFAGDLIEGLIASEVVIVTEADFGTLPCDADDGLITRGFARFLVTGGPETPRPGAEYPVALLSALEGADVLEGEPDIGIFVNENIGTPDCLPSAELYLGFDDPEGGEEYLISHVMRSLIRGMGFDRYYLVNAEDERTSVVTPFLHCLEDGSTGKLWSDMTEAERTISQTDEGDLFWVCPNVVNLGSLRLSSGVGAGGGVEMNTAIDPFFPAFFAPTLFPDDLMEPSGAVAGANLDMTLALLKDIGWSLALEDCTGADDGTPCEDNDPCTAMDLCTAGICTGMTAPGCPTTTTTTLSTTTTSTTMTTTSTTIEEAPVCGDPINPPMGGVRIITATDALFVLETAVGTETCSDCVCDVNSSDSVTATDALFVLNEAVGLPVTLDCPACLPASVR